MGAWEKVQESVEFIRSKSEIIPDIGIILGTGLGGFEKQITDSTVIPYEEIPNFSIPTNNAHFGNLILGKIGGKFVVAMQGRFHFYEGFSTAQIVYPIRVMKLLGIHLLIESNAAGGLNPLFELGNLVIIHDQINLMPENPLTGVNDERFGIRYPDMICPYDNELIRLAEEVALEQQIVLKKGVLVGVQGPNLETKAEYRFLRLIGADMVCMSTVSEVIAAVHVGLRVLGISVISDMCLPDDLEPASLESILAAANKAEPMLTKLVKKFIIRIK